MTPNSNLSPLPIYDTLNEQYHNRPYSYGEVICLIADSRRILPFQSPIDLTSISITTVELISKDQATTIDITTSIVTAGLSIKAFTDYNLLIFPSITQLSITIAPGQWYLKYTFNDDIKYSEVFTSIVAPEDTYIKIIYWGEVNIEYKGGEIDYNDDYKNYIYVDSYIGKPEYPLLEELDNRDGYTYIKHQISEKRFQFEFICAEYMADALRILNLHDHIQINLPDGRIYDVENALVTPKWDEVGYKAIETIEFDVGDTIIKKIGYGVKRGDYNDDYNNDYSNES